MDKLSDLPTSEQKPSPQEQALIQKYLGTPEPSSAAPRQGSLLKSVGIATLVFVMLANPWIDTLLSHMPYCGDNKILLLLVKVVLFSLLFGVILWKV